MPSITVPAVVHDVLDTFHHITRCPVTGWPNTICGSYHNIAEAVNLRHSTRYGYSDIGGALTWLHEHGPDQVGATVNKNGPGRSRTEVVFDNGNRIVVEGNVYMLLIDGVLLTNEKARVIKLGMIEWCDYRISSLRNDVIDLGMFRGNVPRTTPDGRRLRAQLQVQIRSNTEAITLTQTLLTSIAASL